jgi:hypothetical protein
MCKSAAAAGWWPLLSQTLNPNFLWTVFLNLWVCGCLQLCLRIFGLIPAGVFGSSWIACHFGHVSPSRTQSIWMLRLVFSLVHSLSVCLTTQQSWIACHFGHVSPSRTQIIWMLRRLVDGLGHSLSVSLTTQESWIAWNCGHVCLPENKLFECSGWFDSLGRSLLVCLTTQQTWIQLKRVLLEFSSVVCLQYH